MENVNYPWKDSIVMVCADCGKQGPQFQNLPQEIKSGLKKLSKSESGNSMRVVTTSCLGICPEGKIALVIGTNKDPEVFKSYALSPELTSEEIYKKLK